MPSRGSLTCISIVDATICLIRPANRRARGASAISYLLFQVLVVEHPVSSRQQLDLGAPGEESFTLLEHLGRVPVRRADDRDGDLRPAVQVQIAGLGRRHLEP